MKKIIWLLVISYWLFVNLLFAQESPSFQKGLILANTGQYQLAVEELLKVVELEPKHTTAYFLLGLCYTEIGKYDEAISFLEKVKDNFLQSEVLHYTLALLYEKKERWNEAHTSWQKVNILTKSKEIKEMSRKHLKQIEEYLK